MAFEQKDASSMCRAAAIPTLFGAAGLLLSQTSGSSGNAFLANPHVQHSALTTRIVSKVASGTDAQMSQGFIAAGGASTATACGLAAIAGLALQRRSLTQREWRPGFTKTVNPPVFGARDVPKTVLNWEVSPSLPVPGSKEALKSMVGKDVEVGDGEAWDPMGFSNLYDLNFDFNNVMVYPHVQWLREAEIKHGRICMLAFTGMVVQQWWQIPGYPQEPDWTAALDLCYQDPLARLGIAQISIFAMFVEGRWACIDAWIGQMDREPGDLGFDPLAITKKQGFDLEKRQLSELKNGRLAMIGVASMAANHAIPGSVPFLTGAF